MRVDAVFPFRFTFEYWVLTSSMDGNTTYEFKDERTGMLLPTGATIMGLVCAEQMDTPMQVRNLRDHSGKEVFTVNGQSYPMYVTGAEPQLDPFSNVVAWRHQLRRELPREYSDLLRAVVELP